MKRRRYLDLQFLADIWIYEILAGYENYLADYENDENRCNEVEQMNKVMT